MYKEYFGFRETPFSIAPDPRYLYMSTHHQEALGHLLYGIKSGGFVLLTGDVGTGKTTITRCLLEQMPENTDVAFILNPKMTVQELLAAFCDELVINYPAGNKSVKLFVDRINEYLLNAYARGRKTVLIIEEAQNLQSDVLEQIRLLTNLETNQEKLLQIIMIGQPELRKMLARPEMEQLSQRITARYHISPLHRDEIGSYVNHRLMVAGVSVELFPDETMDTLYRFSKGIPRLINVICDRALLGTYSQGKKSVDKPTIVRAAQEVLGNAKKTGIGNALPKWLVVGLILMMCVAAFTSYANYRARSNKNAVSETAAKQKVSDFSVFLKEASNGSVDSAFKELFQQWSLSIAERDADKACDQAQRYGLRCLNGLGNLQELKRLNRPALLKMFDSEHHSLYAVLASTENGTSTLKAGGRTFLLHNKDIEQHWFGEYSLLWKLPPGFRVNVYPRYKGETIVWLRMTLGHILGKSDPGKKDLYDKELVRQVKQFQLSEGLVPDGVVGPHTVIHLNNKTSHEGPVLKREAH